MGAWNHYSLLFWVVAIWLPKLLNNVQTLLIKVVRFVKPHPKHNCVGHSLYTCIINSQHQSIIITIIVNTGGIVKYSYRAAMHI